MKKLVVVITGAAGRIAYALIPQILLGTVFGKDVRISLRLLDVALAESILLGVKLEITDSCFPLLDDLVATTNAQEAFTGADVAVLLGGYPRTPGMERRDLIAINAEGMRDQAVALDMFASKQCKVLVVANPANTNCLVCIKTCKTIPPENFSCLTRLDHERLRGLATDKINMYLEGTGWTKKVIPADIQNVAIFGNHSSTQVPYIDAGTFSMDGDKQPLGYPFTEEARLQLTRRVQQRGAEIMEYLHASSAMSCAVAISKHLQDWLAAVIPTEMFSMGILSNGNPYGVPEDLVFSFPCRREGSTIRIVPGLPLSPQVVAMLDASAAELQAEKADASAVLGPTV